MTVTATPLDPVEVKVTVARVGVEVMVWPIGSVVVKRTTVLKVVLYAHLLKDETSRMSKELTWANLYSLVMVYCLHLMML